MKFMLIMRATDDAKTAYENTPFAEIIQKMADYNEALINAGVLLSGDGLADDLSEAFVVDFAGEAPIVTDGPYGETHELFSGFWIIEVSSKEEAVQWASRAPLGSGSKLEVRRVTDMSDFADFAESDGFKKQAALRVETGKD